MADYDWFTPSEEYLEKQDKHARWLNDNNFIDIPSDAVTLTNFKQLGCTICGAVIISKKWVETHRSVCFKTMESTGKHKR